MSNKVEVLCVRCKQPFTLQTPVATPCCVECRPVLREIRRKLAAEHRTRWAKSRMADGKGARSAEMEPVAWSLESYADPATMPKE